MDAAVAQALASRMPRIDIVIAVAAVSDYRPGERQPGKPPRSKTGLALKLVPNPDIISELGRRRLAEGRRLVLVGFALQAGTPAENLAAGRAKLLAKNLDLIVVNHRSAIGDEQSEVTLVFRDGGAEPLPRQAKRAHAGRIVAAAVQILGRLPEEEGLG
jgi:phosphopantothenoylcysteine decarboxylase/phosphopantothenate--cysteine ligase